MKFTIEAQMIDFTVHIIRNVETVTKIKKKQPQAVINFMIRNSLFDIRNSL